MDPNLQIPAQTQSELAHLRILAEEREAAGPGAGETKQEPNGQASQPGNPIRPIDPEKARKGLSATVRVIDRLLSNKLHRRALRVITPEEADELREEVQIQPDEEEALVELGVEVLAQWEWLAKYSPMLLALSLSGGYFWRVSSAFDDLNDLEARAKKAKPAEKAPEPEKPKEDPQSET